MTMLNATFSNKPLFHPNACTIPITTKHIFLFLSKSSEIDIQTVQANKIHQPLRLKRKLTTSI